MRDLGLAVKNKLGVLWWEQSVFVAAEAEVLP